MILDEIIPSWGTQATVPASNPFMAQALAICEQMRQEHPEVSNPTAAVVVKNGKVLAATHNGSAHETFCPRIAMGSKSGTDYEFCPDHCHFSNHAEPNAAREIKEKGLDATGGELYLAGHYWACMSCWEAAKTVGVTKFFLLENAQEEYKKKRDAGKQGGGKFPFPLDLYYVDSPPAELIPALTKVNISLKPLQSELATKKVIVLFAGAPDFADPTALAIFDYRADTDYRLMLVRLSRDLAILFDEN